MNEKYTRLFESLSLASIPIERTFHLALELVSNDDEITDEYRKELIKEIKALLSNNLSLFGYLSVKDASLDFRKKGKDRHVEIREDIKRMFVSEDDKDFNLHFIIEEEVDIKMDKA